MALIDSAIVTNANSISFNIHGYQRDFNTGAISNDMFNITSFPEINMLSGNASTLTFRVDGNYSSNTEWTTMTLIAINTSTGADITTNWNRTSATVSYSSASDYTQWAWSYSTIPFTQANDGETRVQWSGTGASSSSDYQVTLYFDGQPTGPNTQDYGNTVANADRIEVTLDTTLNSESPNQSDISAQYTWDYVFSRNAVITAGISGGDGDKSYIRCDAVFDVWFVFYRFMYSIGKQIKLKFAGVSGNQRAALPTTALSMNSIHINVSKTSTVSGTTCTLNDADFRAVRQTDSTYDGGDGINQTSGTEISIGEFRNATAGPFLKENYYRSWNGSYADYMDVVANRNRALMVIDDGRKEMTLSYLSNYNPDGTTYFDISNDDWICWTFDYVANWNDNTSPQYENISSSQTLKHFASTSSTIGDITTVEDYLILADSGINYTWDYTDLGNINGGNYHNRRIASFTSVGQQQRWQVSWVQEIPSSWIGSSGKNFSMTVPEEMNASLTYHFE